MSEPIHLWRTFACPSCGGTVDVRSGAYALSVACTHCGTVIDPTDDSYRIIAEARDVSADCLIPLGTRGKLRGVDWDVIGFLHRSDGDGRWSWSEYLLFNPYRGFRWLVHSEGAFSLVETLQQPIGAARANLEVDAIGYRRTNRGSARVDHVRGEFYWRVQAGDEVQVADYESDGGSTLTMERDAREVTWSRGEPVNAVAMQRAFPMVPDSAFGAATVDWSEVSSDAYDASPDFGGGPAHGDGPTATYFVLACFGFLLGGMAGGVMGAFITPMVAIWAASKAAGSSSGNRAMIAAIVGGITIVVMLFVVGGLDTGGGGVGYVSYSGK